MRTLRLVAAAAVLASLTACPDSTADPPPKPRPNILVFLTDDQRMDPEMYKVMPATRRLFRDEGLEFTNAVVTTPLCCPSRASILSGRYVHNHGVRINKDAGKLDQSLTWPVELKKAGYQTGMIGKYLNGYAGNPMGFDKWATFKADKAYTDVLFNINGRRKTVSTYVTTFMRKQALQMISGFEQRDDKPWALYIAVYPPHFPNTPEKKYRSTAVPGWRKTPANSEKDLSDKPAYVREKAKVPNLGTQARKHWRKGMRTLRSVDDLIRAVFKRLDANDERETLSFYLSDNGYQLKEHGVMSKRFPYNESVRVPLLMRWPGKVQPGADNGIVANIDLAATLYDALEIEPGYEVDGRSLLEDSTRTDILIEFFTEVGIPTWSQLWSPARQFIEYEDGTKEFYGPSDPWQLDNVYGNDQAGDEPADEEELSERLSGYRGCAGSTCL